MEEKKYVTGPYRATKLWNDAVRSFHNGIPTQRHWRGLRQYDSCFTASEAVSWLHAELKTNPNFGSGISREQCVKLLRKFLKNDVLRPVRDVKMAPEDFRDNRELYRLSSRSPLKAFRTPVRPPLVPMASKVALKNTRNMRCDAGVSPVLSKKIKTSDSKSNTLPLPKRKIAESEDISSTTILQLQHQRTLDAWQTALFKRIEMVCEQLAVTGDGSSPLVEKSVINASWVRENMLLSKPQFGTLNRKDLPSNDLPSWILSAMRCLANWPSSSESVCNLPSYPGVESDVFKIVRDYFVSPGQPLIPYELYECVVRLYIGAEFLDASNRCPTPLSRSNSCDSIESLMLNISVHSPAADETDGRKDDSSYTDLPPDFFSNRRLEELKLPPNTCFETAFTSNSPLTRVVPRIRSFESSRSGSSGVKSFLAGKVRDSLKRKKSKSRRRAFSSLTSLSTGDSASIKSAMLDSDPLEDHCGYMNPGFTKSNDNVSLVSNPRVDSVSCYSAISNMSKPSSLSNCPVSVASTECSPNVVSSNNTLYETALSQFETSSQSSVYKGEHDYVNVGSLSKSISATNLSDGWSDRTPFEGVVPYIKEGMLGHYKSSPSKTLLGQRDDDAKTCFLGLLTKAGKEACTEALQLLLLLLPPTKRRQLHLLLKMMNKISTNDKIQLETNKTNRALMVQTFSRVVLLSKQEIHYDESLAVRITAFLMDCFADIFTPSAQLAVDAFKEEQKMACIPLTQNITFCEQVPVKVFEEQKLTGSQLFLAELLDQIIDNPKFSRKERTKKLKEFQIHYPEIYERKFPNGVLSLNPSQPKSNKLKLPNIKALAKTKSFRI